MQFRIHKILFVCSSYDGYTLEEDGHIDLQINNEYNELNMSNPPAIVRVSSAAEALERLGGEEKFDIVLTMYNVGGMTVFDFATTIKQMYPQMPVFLITSFSREIYRRVEDAHCEAIDNIFCWHGSADLIIAIIKSYTGPGSRYEDIYFDNSGRYIF